MSANKVCKRCVEWSKIGLSDTCPDCDRADNVPQKPKYHSKSEMKRIECMKEDKPDATPREWWIVRHSNGRRVHARSFEEMNTPQEMRLAHVIEKSYADALKQRVAELEQDHKDDMREYGTMLDEIAAARADSKRLSEAIQDGIDNCCKHTDRIAELEGQLKAKVSLETVFVADSYEAHLTEANAEIERLENQCKAMAIQNIDLNWPEVQMNLKLEKANARIKELEAELSNRAQPMGLFRDIDQLKAREQKLVAFIQSLADGIMADGDHVDTSVSMNAQLLLEALAEHKGGG